MLSTKGANSNGFICPALSGLANLQLLEIRRVTQLAFGELEALAGSLLSILLALLGPRITGEETGLLQLLAKLTVELAERTRNTVPDRPGLSG